MHFLADHRSCQRACVSIGRPTVHFLASRDLATSWAAVKTNEMPYALKLASGDLTSWAAGDTISLLESSWDGPVYTAATFLATVLFCEFLVQTGLKRERERQKMKKTLSRSKNRDRRVQGSCLLRSLTLQLAWFTDIATPALRHALCQGGSSWAQD